MGKLSFQMLLNKLTHGCKSIYCCLFQMCVCDKKIVSWVAFFLIETESAKR